MGRYVPRSGWAEQKTSRESCCGKQQSITLVNQSFDERKIVVLRSDASDKTAKQNESDDRRVGGGALARWPPSAAQTARTVFPYAAFTKTQ
jgi:hypothetical protein